MDDLNFGKMSLQNQTDTNDEDAPKENSDERNDRAGFSSGGALYIPPHRRSRPLEQRKEQSYEAESSIQTHNSYWAVPYENLDINALGLTERDNFWGMIMEMYEMNKELFRRCPLDFRSRCINCYPFNTHDENSIRNIARLIMTTTNLIYPIIYFDHKKDKKYMYTDEGEFYKLVSTVHDKYMYKFRGFDNLKGK